MDLSCAVRCVVAGCVMGAAGLTQAATTPAKPAAAAAAGAAKAPAAQTNRTTFEFVVVPSVFQEDPKGRDPFFPNSTRGKPVEPVRPVTQSQPDPAKSPGTTVRAPDPVPAKDPYAGLMLKAVTGNFALINNQPFGVGETLTVRSAVSTNRVKLISIKDRTVVVQIEGRTDTRELQMRMGADR
jgi:hypothetical protein